MKMFEEGRKNDVEVHWERPLNEKSNRVKVTCESRKS